MGYWNRHLLHDGIFSARKISFSVSIESASSVKSPNEPVRTFINLLVLFVLGNNLVSYCFQLIARYKQFVLYDWYKKSKRHFWNRYHSDFWRISGMTVFYEIFLQRNKFLKHYLIYGMVNYMPFWYKTIVKR